jgi:hypothetical protein
MKINVVKVQNYTLVQYISGHKGVRLTIGVQCHVQHILKLRNVRDETVAESNM